MGRGQASDLEEVRGGISWTRWVVMVGLRGEAKGRLLRQSAEVFEVPELSTYCVSSSVCPVPRIAVSLSRQL